MKASGNESNKKVHSILNIIKRSQIVSALVVILLVLLIFLVGSKVSWLFNPIKDFLSIVGLPIVLAGVFYYLLNPLVDSWERRFKINRTLTISFVFLILIGLIVWGLWTLIPVINQQIQSMITSIPAYIDHISRDINGAMKHPLFNQFSDQVEHWTKTAGDELSAKSSSYLKTTVNSLGDVVGTITTIVVAIITMPFILFYLLRDGKNLPHYMAKFVPDKGRKSFFLVLTEINTQISNYVRGQLTVAFFVGIMFWLGYLTIGLKYALTIGIIAGILNMIPYLGSFLAMVPAVLVGAFISPWMLVKVFIVFVIEQTIEGRVLSPLILGSNLKIHPVTIIVVLLAAGKMFGVLGVIFGIPGYAVLKVLISHLFEWYQLNSPLYETKETDTLKDEDQQI
ncbi:AI-2E family transporter [Paucilactobacillus nenjiangensis]|uniref:AI-2E family transporter n=1 Tax=Paucilactobacillus nenjiangensis TaxID=1296540 RepID=A0A5P1X5M5_9LACO|nr:AI-2E family transporter [Paucilactobacillus nenjiangensis]QER67771.1 AI-2E family transporter [Paucilactobacillus nenjiangensis]